MKFKETKVRTENQDLENAQIDKKKIKCSKCEHSKWSEYFQAFTCEHSGCKDVPIFKGSTHPRCCPLINTKGHYHRPTKGLGTLPKT